MSNGNNQISADFKRTFNLLKAEVQNTKIHINNNDREGLDKHLQMLHGLFSRVELRIRDLNESGTNIIQ